MAPNLLDANVVFTDNATSFFASDVTGLNLLTTMNISGSTAGMKGESMDH